MKARFLAMAVLAILCGLMMGFEPPSRVYKIDVRVFQILPIQTVTSAGTDKNGNIVGTTMGGDVTAGFPSHPVVLQTDLTLKAGEEEFKGILYDRKFLPRSLMPAVGGPLGSSRALFDFLPGERIGHRRQSQGIS